MADVDILEIGAELLKANPELSVPEDQEESVLAELRTHLADIEQELRRDQEELDAIRSRTPPNVMPLLLAAGAASVTLLALMVITIFRWPWDLSGYRTWWFLAGPLLVGVDLASLFRFRNVQRTVMAHARDEQAALGGLRIQAQTEVTRHLRHILNERAGMESDLGSTLLTEEAPALVEIDAYTKPVPSSTYNRLKRFIQEHDTSAVGLAGPRGVGKSTAMHALQHDTELNCVPIYVNAPVVYAAPDLIRLIDRKLIGEILGPTASDPTDPRWFRRSREEWLLRRVAGGARSIWAWVVIAAIVVLIVDQTRQAAATAAQEAANKHPLSLAAMAFIGMGVIGGLYAAFRPSTADKRPKLPHRSPTLVQSVAFDRLTRLHWASSVEHTVKAGLSAEPVSAEGESKTTHAPRTLSHPEEVASLRDFMRLAADQLKRPVIVCVDELDKISKPDQAIELINTIKDLFHVEGVHVLVSVSTDAMHSFAARGVPVRDAFDSSLDSIEAMGRLEWSESRELLRGRVTYFPDAAAAFCHAWAGGHPRDLIRAARAMVIVKRATPGPVPIVNLVDAVLRNDVAEAVDACRHSLPEGCDKKVRLELIRLAHDLRDPAVRFPDAIDLRLTAIAGHVEALPSGSVLAEALPAYLRVARRTWQLFTVPNGARPVAQVEDVAQARWTLASEPLEATLLIERWQASEPAMS